MKRHIIGRINGVTAEPGTILGPNDTKEYLVVVAQGEDWVDVGFAQKGDIEEAMKAPEPRSVSEHWLRQMRRQ